MKLSDFILLSEDEKKGTLLHEGVLIGKRTVDTQIIFLFQINNYYVETYCNTHSRSVDEFRVFTNLETLHPYLAHIKVSDLLN